MQRLSPANGQGPGKLSLRKSTEFAIFWAESAELKHIALILKDKKFQIRP
jgi:hypothetical protein